MIIVSNSEDQTIAPGKSLVFDTTIFKTGCDCCRRGNTTVAKIKSSGIYRISFGANIGATANATTIQASVQVGGQTLPEMTAISYTQTAGVLNSVYKSTLYKVCCGDFSRVTITNTGSTNLTIGANATLTIEKIS